MSARDVIAEELKDHGADFLGDSRDDIADAILFALDAAGFKIIHTSELMKLRKMMLAASTEPPKETPND